MKNIIIALLLTICSASFAQMRIVYPNADSLKIAWNAVTTDIEGNPEHVSYYWVLKFRILNGDTLLTDTLQTAKDDTTFNPLTSMWISNFEKRAKYFFGVSAVDWAGNTSSIHLSTDVTASDGGWYLAFDTINPRIPERLRKEEVR